MDQFFVITTIAYWGKEAKPSSGGLKGRTLVGRWRKKGGQFVILRQSSRELILVQQRTSEWNWTAVLSRMIGLRGRQEKKRKTDTGLLNH